MQISILWCQTTYKKVSIDSQKKTIRHQNRIISDFFKVHITKFTKDKKIMKAEIIGNYINKKRLDNGLTYEAVANISNIPESTVKNVCTGKTDNPSMATIIPIMDAVGGSYDEMLHPGKTKDEVKESSVTALKEIYEFQIASMKETSEAHIQNIRAHYEQHHQDLVENFEKRLSDKKEINESLKEQIKDLKKANFIKNIIMGIFVCGVIALFVLELMHPEHGWLRY